MNIISFGTTMPIRQAYDILTQKPIPIKIVNNLTKTLVGRINANKNEALILQKCVPDLYVSGTPIAASTNIGRNYSRLRTLIFGEDAVFATGKGEDCFEYKKISKGTRESDILRNIIEPLSKRVKSKTSGKPLGINILAENKNGKYKLKDIEIVEINDDSLVQLDKKLPAIPTSSPNGQHPSTIDNKRFWIIDENVKRIDDGEFNYD